MASMMRLMQTMAAHLQAMSTTTMMVRLITLTVIRTMMASPTPTKPVVPTLMATEK